MTNQELIESVNELFQSYENCKMDGVRGCTSLSFIDQDDSEVVLAVVQGDLWKTLMLYMKHELNGFVDPRTNEED